MIGRRIKREDDTPGVLFVLTEEDYAELETGLVELSCPLELIGFVALTVAKDEAAALAKADDIAPIPPELVQ